MTTKEFGPIAALIDNCCKDDFDEVREGAYALVLAPLPAPDVRQAVLNLLGRPGGAWVPSTREIAAEVHAVQFVGTPQWAGQRLGALVPSELRNTAWGHDPVDVDTIAEQILAVHDEHGRHLLTVVRQLGLALCLRGAELWSAPGQPCYDAWMQSRFAALPSGQHQVTADGRG